MGTVGYRWVEKHVEETQGTPNTVLELMEQIRVQINQARVNARRGLAMLTPSNNLMRAAQRDIDRWTGHIDVPVGDALTRAREQYWTGQTAAAIWAEGSLQPLEMLDAWLRTPATAVVIDGDWNEMGVAFGGSTCNLRCVVFVGKRQAWPHDELPIQDAVEVAMRDGLSYIPIYPLTLTVGVG